MCTCMYRFAILLDTIKNSDTGWIQFQQVHAHGCDGDCGLYQSVTAWRGSTLPELCEFNGHIALEASISVS